MPGPLLTQKIDPTQFQKLFPIAKQRLSSSETPECECGAKKTGIKDFMAGHSHWCPVAAK